MKRYTVKEKITEGQWPDHTRSGQVSKLWEKAHRKANREALKKYGSAKAKDIARLVKQTPDGELLGKHNKSGKITVSKLVPARLRDAVAYHEFVESEIMRKKKR